VVASLEASDRRLLDVEFGCEFLLAQMMRSPVLHHLECYRASDLGPLPVTAEGGVLEILGGNLLKRLQVRRLHDFFPSPQETYHECISLEEVNPIIEIVWWVNQELLHHGAEIALLRDLYRMRSG